jgi:hypothetical protein
MSRLRLLKTIFVVPSFFLLPSIVFGGYSDGERVSTERAPQLQLAQSAYQRQQQAHARARQGHERRNALMRRAQVSSQRAQANRLH